MERSTQLTLAAVCLLSLAGAVALWVADQGKQPVDTTAAKPIPAEEVRLPIIDPIISEDPEVWPRFNPPDIVEGLIEDERGYYMPGGMPDFAPRYEPSAVPPEPAASPRSGPATSWAYSSVRDVARREPQRVQQAPPPAPPVFPEGFDKAAQNFNTHLTGTYLPSKIRLWERDQSVPRVGVGSPPVLLYKTQTDRNGTTRTYWVVESFTKDGEFQVRPAEYAGGHGLLLGNVEKLDLAKAGLDDWSLESLFNYYSDTRNDADGNALLAGFAAWLYKNGADWAGNRALTYLGRRQALMVPEIQSFIRERHKFAADAALAPTRLVGYLNWEETIPSTLEKDRNEAREKVCRDMMEVLRTRIEQSFTNGARATMDSLSAEPPARRRGPLPVGISLPQMEVEIQQVELFCRGTQAQAKDTEAYEAVKEARGKDKERKATLAFWIPDVRERIKKMEELSKEIVEIMADADSIRRAAVAMREDGQGEQKYREAYKRYDEAAEKLRQLVPTKSSPRGGPLDPYNGFHWAQLAEALRYACVPDRNLDRCDDDSKARESVVAAAIALRHFPSSVNIRVNRGVSLMLTKNFGDARKQFEELEKDPKVPGSTKATVKLYIEQIDRIESKEIRERKLKGMGKG